MVSAERSGHDDCRRRAARTAIRPSAHRIGRTAQAAHKGTRRQDSGRPRSRSWESGAFFFRTLETDGTRGGSDLYTLEIRSDNPPAVKDCGTEKSGTSDPPRRTVGRSVRRHRIETCAASPQHPSAASQKHSDRKCRPPMKKSSGNNFHCRSQSPARLIGSVVALVAEAEENSPYPPERILGNPVPPRHRRIGTPNCSTTPESGRLFRTGSRTKSMKRQQTDSPAGKSGGTGKERTAEARSKFRRGLSKSERRPERPERFRTRHGG